MAIRLRLTQSTCNKILINMVILLSCWVCQVNATSAAHFDELTKSMAASLDRGHLFSPVRGSAFGYFIKLKSAYLDDIRIVQYEEMLIKSLAEEFDKLLIRKAYTDAALLVPKVELISPSNKTAIAMQKALVIATASTGVNSKQNESFTKKTDQPVNKKIEKKSRIVEKKRVIDNKKTLKKTVQHNLAISKISSDKDTSMDVNPKLDQKVSSLKASSDWLEETSLPETLDTFYLRSRNSFSGTETIENSLKPVCENIVQQNASVKIHTVSEKDYRWLMVKLMLCTRKINKKFWLRHSYVVSQSNFLKVTLHPKRDVALSLTQPKL